MSLEHIVFLKNIICILNALLLAAAIWFETGFSQINPGYFIMLAVVLGPILLWNSWLYHGFFETEGSRLIVSYKLFQVIGLLMVFSLFMAMVFFYDWNKYL